MTMEPPHPDLPPPVSQKYFAVALPEPLAPELQLMAGVAQMFNTLLPTDGTGANSNQAARARVAQWINSRFGGYNSDQTF